MALCITRRQGETVMITVGDTQVVLTVTEFKGKQVRLAFESEQGVKVMRGELLAGGRADLEDFPQ